MSQNLTLTHGELLAASVPAIGAVAVASNTAFAACRSLLVGTAGTATVTMVNGSVGTNMPLQAGYNPLQCTKVVFGTAADVWALY